MRELLWMIGESFLIAFILTPIVRDVFRAYEVFDRPGHRKPHPHPIPRVGGIAVASAYVIPLVWTAGSDSAISAHGFIAWQLLPGAALVFFTGLLDDFFSLRPLVKFLAVVAAATIVFWNGLHVGTLALHALPLWLDYPVTVFWLLLTSNALNLIDGLDGLCAGMGALATLTLSTAALLDGNLLLAYATLPLAGALFGFLCYNTHPATVFLGDSGALSIGFLLGCYGMIWTQKATTLLSMLLPLLILLIPLLDLSLAVVRRFLRNQPIFGADADHIHHRLLSRGLSPGQTVGVLDLIAAVVAALALLATTKHSSRYQGFILALFCVAVWFGIRKLRYAEFGIAGRLLFGGRFQKTVNRELRMLRIASALERADDDESWWNALVGEGEALDLVAARWVGPHGVRQVVLAGNKAPAWSLHIPLSETDSLELEGSFGEAVDSANLIGFAEKAGRTFAAIRRPASEAADGRMAAALP